MVDKLKLDFIVRRNVQEKYNLRINKLINSHSKTLDIWDLGFDSGISFNHVKGNL